MTEDEAIARFRLRWLRLPFSDDEKEEIRERIPIGWSVVFQDVKMDGWLTSVARVFTPPEGGNTASAYVRTAAECIEAVERLMPLQPRRAKKLTGREVLESYGAELPMAYLCKVLKDEWDPFDRHSFLAECCNPDCDGRVTNRYASPWCDSCGKEIPFEWMRWFFSNWRHPKALQRLIRDVL